MTLRSQFKTDPKAVVDGVWVSYEANPDGTIPRFKIARMSSVNPRYAKFVKEHTAKTEGRELTEAEKEAFGIELFVDASLLAWENYQPEEDGNALPYSRENAIGLMNDPSWRDMADDLRVRAMKMNDFRARKIEAVTKNS